MLALACVDAEPEPPVANMDAEISAPAEAPSPISIIDKNDLPWTLACLPDGEVSHVHQVGDPEHPDIWDRTEVAGVIAALERDPTAPIFYRSTATFSSNDAFALVTWLRECQTHGA